MALERRRLPKYREVFDTLLAEIHTGRLRAGDRLPSEAELERRFGASRITVGRAVRDLQLAGLVQRRAGSGTFVRPAGPGADIHLIGLLIPEAGHSEMFDAMLAGVMSAPTLGGADGARAHALLQGSVPPVASSSHAAVIQLCRHYIDRHVAGVLFAPLELAPDASGTNRQVLDMLDRAGVPVVLLDRAVAPYPARSQHDVVGIDNRRAGCTVTAHLIRCGSTRLAFAGRAGGASTIEARLAGYREALLTAGLWAGPDLEFRDDPSATDRFAAFVREHRPDGVVCANDRTAALVMRALLDLGYRVPEDIRLAGIDDADYAAWLPVPLTTLRQPARAIGMAAVLALLERIAQPTLPPRDILLHATLVVRRSCGSPASTAGAASPRPDLDAGHGAS